MKQNKYKPGFSSVFASQLTDFLELKHSLGYKYESEARILQRIDKFFSSENIETLELPEDAILKWSIKNNYESPKTHFTRISILRQFIVYLNERGFLIALPTQTRKYKLSKSFTPYIFTHEQISRLIENADKMTKPKRQSNMNVIFPAFLRLLYCCGLRVSEASSLRLEDFNIARGTVTIRESKNDNTRIIPMSDSLNNYMLDYFQLMHTKSGSSDFVFPNPSEEQYSKATFYQYFRKILWQSGISHGGRGKGPRLHDLRHTFAVHSLKNWILQDLDTYTLLPILSAYLGHKNIYATEKYLRLTSEMYPNILEKVKTNCGEIIPEVISYETN